MDGRVYEVHAKHPYYSKEMLSTALYLLEKGDEFNDIGERLGVSYNVVKRLRRLLGLPPRKTGKYRPADMRQYSLRLIVRSNTLALAKKRAKFRGQSFASYLVGLLEADMK